MKMALLIPGAFLLITGVIILFGGLDYIGLSADAILSSISQLIIGAVVGGLGLAMVYFSLE